MLFTIEKAHRMNLPYYWFKEGIVVDPESLTQQTGGVIKFKWDDECSGCQIQRECPCEGNPHRKDYSSRAETLEQHVNDTGLQHGLKFKQKDSDCCCEQHTMI